jgi:hypothetical protein
MLSEVQEVFEVIYNSPGCLEEFHKRQGFRNVCIEPWVDGARTVGYSVSAPPIVTNIFGTVFPGSARMHCCNLFCCRTLGCSAQN